MKNDQIHWIFGFNKVGALHTAIATMDVVRKMFPGRFISRLGDMHFPFTPYARCTFKKV